MASASINNPHSGGNACAFPILTVIAGHPVVSSLDIAKHFGKRHDHVIRSVQSIIRNSPESFAAPNLGASEYTDPSGRTLTAYNLTRDGFTLLAMGFTGKKALAWKLRYIEAFNAMEAELAARRETETADGLFLRRLSRLSADVRAGLLRLAQRIEGRGAQLDAVTRCYRGLVEEITIDMQAGESVALPGDAPWTSMIEHFLAERCTVAPGLWVQAGKLYAAFETWAHEKSIDNPPSSIAFGRVLRRRFTQHKANVYRWQGLTLAESANQTAPAAAKGVMQ